MDREEKLYASLGELIYAVAKADGKVQESENQILEDLIKDHPWAKTIRWSYQYELEKNSDPEQIYQKVINNCESYGPAAEYLEFIDIITQVAGASEGIDDNEQQVISSFSHDLVERFRRDIGRIGT